MLRYAISEGLLDRQGGTGDFVTRCKQLGADGVEFLLLRERALGVEGLLMLARRVVETVRGSGMQVIVPGSAELTLAAEAAGVHLSGRPGELRVNQVRAVSPAAWVSVSCHTVEEIRCAREDGASAVLFAPVFGKMVDGVEVVGGVGLERLQEACDAAGKMPVFALGGVTEANAEECVKAGARGVAGIRMFFDRRI